MDSTLPQMQPFDFDKLHPIALEDTLAYLRQHPEPPAEDVALCGSYQGLLDGAAGERGWMAEPLQDMGGQSRLQLDHSPDSSSSNHSRTSRLSSSSENRVNANDGLMGFHESTALPPKPISASATLWEKCGWDRCQEWYPNSDLSIHLQHHSCEALARWTLQSTCTWQGCKSKSKFKTTHQFNKHLENIHTKPLLCTKSRCSHKQPFRNKHELERHNFTKHSTERPWECPYDSCPSETRTFARKDKWLKHIREMQHENDAFCPFFHCSLEASKSGEGFTAREEIKGHFSVCHVGRDIDESACALGSCGIIRKHDRWTAHNLFLHLLQQHNIWYPLYLCEKKIFRLEDVPEPWIDCNICALQSPTPLHAVLPFSPSGTAPS